MDLDSTPRAAPLGRPLSLADHVRRTLKLAFPVMAARAGMVIMISVDTAMCGYAGEAILANYGIAVAPMVFVLVLGIGLLTGTVVLIAQACGAGREDESGRTWRAALILAAIIGLAGGSVLMLGEDLLLFFGQEAEIAAGGGGALQMAALGMPGILLFISCTMLLEALNRPRPGMTVALAANILNAGLNWLLIEGQLGAPALGAAGAMLATSLTRWSMFLVLVGYILGMKDSARFRLRGSFRGLGPTMGKLLRIGLPFSLAVTSESGTFAAATFFAGLMGSTALAAFQAAHNVTIFVFMLAIGLGTATAVRVANAVGRRDRSGLARAGWIGLCLVAGLMLVIAVGIGSFERQVARIYSDEAPVLEIMVQALSVIALLVIADGVQAVVISALRGAGDVLVPTAIFAVCFLGLGIPLSYALGLGLDWGVPGLLWGLLLALVLACSLLLWRFAAISRRDISPL